MSWLDNALYLASMNRILSLDLMPYAAASEQQGQAGGEGEKRSRHSVESPPVIVHIEGRIVYANSAAVELAGGEQLEDLVGKRLQDFVPPDDQRNVLLECIHHILQETEKAEVLTGRFTRLDGQVIDVEVVAIPTTYQGKPVTQAIILDVSGRKRAEKDGSEQRQLYGRMQRYVAELEERLAERTAELQAANERLRALSRVKDEFISNITYELRTPITSIQLYHDLLGLDPKKDAVYVERLQTETSRLVQIIEGLQQLSRLDQERVRTNLAAVELNEVVEAHTSDHAPIVGRKGLTLTFDKEADLPSLKADPELIGQAFGILLSNALNYTPAGGQVVVKTQASQFEGKGWVGLCVSDNGPGIPLEEQPRIFERFFRGTAGRDSSPPGVGLGLAIAKEIVDQHGGRIEVESQGVPGKGATFYIWLPVNTSSNRAK